MTGFCLVHTYILVQGFVSYELKLLKHDMVKTKPSNLSSYWSDWCSVSGCSLWLSSSLRPFNEGAQGDLQITELQDRWLPWDISGHFSCFKVINLKAGVCSFCRYLFSRTSQWQSLWMARQVKDVSSHIHLLLFISSFNAQCRVVLTWTCPSVNAG